MSRKKPFLADAPMPTVLGDSGAGLHKSSDTPCWDAVLTCWPGKPVGKLLFSEQDKREADTELQQWMAKNPDVNFNKADQSNYSLSLY